MASTLFGAVLLATSGTALAVCEGPGAPTTTQTKCLTAIQIPGAAIRSYDISWVNPDRAEYYLADRSNSGIDVINTQNLTFKRTIPGFVGIVLNAAGTAVDNNHSGPDGVVSHGRWLYAGDGDSTLKVIDLDAPDASAIKQSISTGGTTRVDEMALTTDGELLLAANNAEDPPFATLFLANGDGFISHVTAISKITIADSIVPAGFGLSMEQPAWDPTTKRFYVSVPIIAENPAGCNFDADAGPINCDGGLAVIDPETLAGVPAAVLGVFDPATNTGVVPLHACGPNGATVGVHDNLLLGCTPANNPSDATTLVINAKTKNFANIGNIVGSDEVWFNKGDKRYYTASNRNCKTTAPCPTAAQQAAVLGVIDGTSVLIETIPQSSGSHSVAADSKRNLIFVPESAPAVPVLAGDTTTVGAGICGSDNGCIGVYIHKVEKDRDRKDRDRERDR
ncbi:MAG: hypothetical protein ACTHLX_04975 [Candidatus Binatia bacterium]